MKQAPNRKKNVPQGEIASKQIVFIIPPKREKMFHRGGFSLPKTDKQMKERKVSVPFFAAANDTAERYETIPLSPFKRGVAGRNGGLIKVAFYIFSDGIAEVFEVCCGTVCEGGQLKRDADYFAATVS